MYIGVKPAKWLAVVPNLRGPSIARPLKSPPPPTSLILNTKHGGNHEYEPSHIKRIKRTSKTTPFLHDTISNSRPSLSRKAKCLSRNETSPPTSHCRHFTDSRGHTHTRLKQNTASRTSNLSSFKYPYSSILCSPRVVSSCHWIWTC